MKRLPRHNKLNPPSTNRGVQNTTPLPCLEGLVDWCAFTVKDFQAIEELLKVMGISLDEFMQMPKGGLGYKVHQRYGNIAIFSDGKPEMGIHVEMSGQGCRQFDSLSGKWCDLFSKVFMLNGRFTRVDLAIDDREGLLSLATIQEKMKRREIRSRFKAGREITSYDFSDDSKIDGKTLYFGSTKSDVKIRIYDKAAEQGVEGVWIRTEVECRRERSNILASFLCEASDIGTIIAGVLKNYVLFVEPSPDSNKSRWSVSLWWSDFLGTVEKLKLTIKKADRTIEQVREWFSRQAAPSLALIFKYFGGDLDRLTDIILEGEKRLKPRHMAMLCMT